MSNRKIIAFKKPGEISEDPLTELLRSGARQLIANAVEAELDEYLLQFAALKDVMGHKQVVRNGYLPEREIQTGIGPVLLDWTGALVLLISAVMLYRRRSILKWITSGAA